MQNEHATATPRTEHIIRDYIYKYIVVWDRFFIEDQRLGSYFSAKVCAVGGHMRCVAGGRGEDNGAEFGDQHAIFE